MSDFKELPHLLRLLDDESEVVRSAVKDRLLRFEADLPSLIAYLPVVLETPLKGQLTSVYREAQRENFVSLWSATMETAGELPKKLESALGLISDYLDDRPLSGKKLGDRLDGLAAEMAIGEVKTSGMNLVGKLFQSGRFKGNREDYYSPENSNLLWVIDEGKGNPISLVSLLILIGDRLGVSVGGCNYPGHFLAQVEENGAGTILIDCYNGGEVVDPDELLDAPAAFSEMSSVLKKAAPVDVILLRYLRNLQNAFHRKKRREDQRMVARLISELASNDLSAG
ncbi:MAG: transglutaminase family protein [Verrucomicrobiota bacterium]